MLIPKPKIMQLEEELCNNLNREIIPLLNDSEHGIILEIPNDVSIEVLNKLKKGYVANGWNFTHIKLPFYEKVKTKRFIFTTTENTLVKVINFIVIFDNLINVSKINHQYAQNIAIEVYNEDCDDDFYFGF